MVLEKLTLWLADENEHYVELMKRYIRTSAYKNKLNIATYTDSECFKHAIEHLQHEAIVLVTPHFIPICSEHVNSIVISLSEESIKERAQPSNCIYKYRPLNQILDQVMNIYYASKGVNGSHGAAVASMNDPKVIAVYAASGGSGVTTLTQQLSEFYMSLGKRVFYLNLEPIHSMLNSSLDGAVNRFTQVLYMIKSGQPLLGKLHQLLQSEHSGHYDMFYPSRYSREWLEYEREDIELLLQAIKITGRYDIIMLDVACPLFSTTIGALEYCDEIIWVIPDRIGAMSKVEYVNSELGRISDKLLSQIRSKCTYVLQLFHSSQTLKVKMNVETHTVLPFNAEWHLSTSSSMTAPAPYRQALLRLIGNVMNEEMKKLGGHAG